MCYRYVNANWNNVGNLNSVRHEASRHFRNKKGTVRQALVNAVMDHQVPLNAGNFLTSWEPVSFSRRTLLYGVSILMQDLRFSHWCCWGFRFSGMCHWVIFWRVLMPWSSCSLRRVVVILPSLGLLDPWSGRQFCPLQQEPLTYLCSITFQQIWIIHFDRMQHSGTENLNAREKLAVQLSAYILNCSLCVHLDRPVWVEHVLSYLLHLSFRRPNVISEGWQRIHLSLRLSAVPCTSYTSTRNYLDH
jgi:hypothetical protein